MTNPQVDAGRELDAAIAEEIFGAFVRENEKGRFDLVIPGGVNRVDFVHRDGAKRAAPRYSTEIEAAWEVVGRFNDLGYYVDVSQTSDGRAFCKIMRSNQWLGDPIESGECETASLAICRAALAAVRLDDD